MCAQIKGRINGIKPYFRKMEVSTSEGEEPIIYVSVSFPGEWKISPVTEEKFGVMNAEDGGLIYFYTDLENGADAVFDAIEYNITQNKIAEEKVLLFQTKLKELKEVFSNEENTIEKLRSLKFTFMEKQEELSLSYPSNANVAVSKPEESDGIDDTPVPEEQEKPILFGKKRKGGKGQ